MYSYDIVNILYVLGVLSTHCYHKINLVETLDSVSRFYKQFSTHLNVPFVFNRSMTYSSTYNAITCITVIILYTLVATNKNARKHIQINTSKVTVTIEQITCAYLKSSRSISTTTAIECTYKNSNTVILHNFQHNHTGSYCLTT